MMGWTKEYGVPVRGDPTRRAPPPPAAIGAAALAPKQTVGTTKSRAPISFFLCLLLSGQSQLLDLSSYARKIYVSCMYSKTA